MADALKAKRRLTTEEKEDTEKRKEKKILNNLFLCVAKRSVFSVVKKPFISLTSKGLQLASRHF